MDILHLNYFIEVARQRSFTKASRTLLVSQPSISKVIKTLENELGVTLFIRRGREIALTDVGEAVFKRAQIVVGEFKDLSNEIHDVVNVEYGEITVGLPPMIGANFFPKIIRKYKKRYPKVTLKLIEVGSKQIELDVKNGILDIGVVALPLSEQDIQHFSFINETLQAVLPAAHALAGKKSLLLTDLKDESFILYSNDFSLNDLIYEKCQQQNFTPSVICQSSHWDFIAEMVAEGLGVALLPETICKDLDERVVSIPLDKTVIPWNLALIWKKDKYLSFAARQWLKLAEAHFTPRPSAP